MRVILVWALLVGATPPAATPPVALKGLDPVSLIEGRQVQGRTSLQTHYGAFTYAFATKAHQQQFLADPERFGIQGQGRCLHMPQMAGDPRLFKVVDGKIYLAGSTGCLASLQGELIGYVRELNKPRKKVAILVFPQVQVIDYTGPWEVFGEAGYDVFSVAATTEPLVTNMGMIVTPNYTLTAAPKADILVLPGGGMPDKLGPTNATVKWIKVRAQQVEIAMSVCNGAFWLASAGLLDGQRATTTANGNLSLLAKNYPRIHVVADERFVDNGRIVTTGGLSSGIDGALHVVERLDGRAAAQSVALSMEYDWRPDSGYVRGAMADKYILRLGEFELPDSVQLTNGEQNGDRDHWQRSWEITSPQLNGQKLGELLDVMFARSWSKVDGSSDKTGERTRWAFNGDDGKPWKALAMVRPAAGGTDKFVFTVSVEKSTP